MAHRHREFFAESTCPLYTSGALALVGIAFVDQAYKYMRINVYSSMKECKSARWPMVVVASGPRLWCLPEM